jgi:mRNA-degrading endonuclease RelE of RelBE toxin-antitoxin system
VQLIVAPAAVKEMTSLPQGGRDGLIAKAEAFANEPFAQHSWAPPLRGAPDRIRIRQGDFRAILLMVRARGTVVLEKVVHRREVYR